MISTSDIIKLPYGDDLTESGIVYAKRILATSNVHSNGSLNSRLRSMVGSVAVELAFRRYLGENTIPFDVKSTAPFSDHDKYDVLLGGHRCDVHTQLISKRNQIKAVRRNPQLVLRAPASIPDEKFSAANHFEHDLNLFAFLLGLTTNSPEEIKKAVDVGQRTYLIHPLMPDWSHPQVWAPLGQIALKSESPDPLKVEIGGLDADRNFINETLLLEPLKRIFASNKYYSLAYFHVDDIPPARLGLYSPGKAQYYLAQPYQWGNIWVYGLEIWLAGYMQHDEFRRNASAIFAGSRVFQYSDTQVKNMSLPVSHLRSLENLFLQVKDWVNEKKSISIDKVSLSFLFDGFSNNNFNG